MAQSWDIDTEEEENIKCLFSLQHSLMENLTHQPLFSISLKVACPPLQISLVEIFWLPDNHWVHIHIAAVVVVAVAVADNDDGCHTHPDIGEDRILGTQHDPGDAVTSRTSW